jgi:hypothetical protein
MLTAILLKVITTEIEILILSGFDDIKVSTNEYFDYLYSKIYNQFSTKAGCYTHPTFLLCKNMLTAILVKVITTEIENIEIPF